MTTHKHTPEPWKWGLGTNPILYSDQGCRPIVLSAHHHIVHLGERSDGMGGIMVPAAEFMRNGQMTHPDGVLIEAAPALLAELEQGFIGRLSDTLRSVSDDVDANCEANGYVTPSDLGNWLRAKADRIEDAIKLATGEKGGGA